MKYYMTSKVIKRKIRVKIKESINSFKIVGVDQEDQTITLKAIIELNSVIETNEIDEDDIERKNENAIDKAAGAKDANETSDYTAEAKNEKGMIEIKHCFISYYIPSGPENITQI